MDEEEWLDLQYVRRDTDVIEDEPRRSEFTGLFDPDGTPIYRSPMAKPSAGFLSGDDFSVDTELDFYEPIDVRKYAPVSKCET